MTSASTADTTATTPPPSSPPAGVGGGAPANDRIDQAGEQAFVPGHLVHKERADQVLLTGGVRLARDEFLITAMLPTADDPSRSPDRDGRLDPMLASEAVRQAGYYISHRFHGVPQTHVFVLGELTLETDGTVPPSHGGARLPVTLRVRCAPTARWTRNRVGMRLAVELSAEGRVCGHGSLRSEALDQRVHRVIRRRPRASGAAAPASRAGRLLSPGEVGRRAEADVLLARHGSDEAWALSVDLRHPVLFEHEVDHVPGMVLLEAFRQAALAATGSADSAGRPAAFSGLRTEFTRYCELDAPTRITAVPEPRSAPEDHLLVRVAAEQEGARVATGAVTLRSIASRCGVVTGR